MRDAMRRVLVLATLLVVLPAMAADVEIRMVPAGPASVTQGRAFAFDVLARNAGAVPVSIAARFLVGPGERARATPFAVWQDVIPPGGSVRIRQQVTASRWFAELGPFSVVAEVQPASAAPPPLPFEVLPSPVPVPRFKDVTASSGIDSSIPRPVACRWAAGGAWADVDGDGALDLYVPQATEPSQLWINDGTGHFTDQAAMRGVDDGGSTGIGAVFADFDRDGDPDLYVSNDGPNRLYRNDGTGHFVDVAAPAGVDDAHQSFGAAWGDYDGDGWPDLYVTNYRLCTSRAHGAGPYQPDRLYHNEGDGTFSDRTALLPVSSTEGAGFQAGWFDFDGDGDPDLYLANDAIGEGFTDHNHLWRNDGPTGGGGWAFTDVSDRSGAGFDINSMGLGIGDYDRDLDLDLAVSNIGPTVLARNEGNGTFTDVARSAGVDRPSQSPSRSSITWGLAFADLNMDGWEDLSVNAGALVVNEPQPNALFANATDGTFLDLSGPSGAADPASSKGLALVDFDRDGRIDLFVVDQGGRAHLFRNVTAYAGRHWLEVRLTGTASNTDGCGARLTFTVTGGSMLREVFCGSCMSGWGAHRRWTGWRSNGRRARPRC